MVGDSVASALHEERRYYTIKLYAFANKAWASACYCINFINYSRATLYDD